jgi:hypothetical protein
MPRIGVLVSLGALLTATAAWADEHEEMRAAQHELKIVKRHLQAAGRDYEGHRRAALDHVDQALREVRQALALVARRGPRREPGEGGRTD